MIDLGALLSFGIGWIIGTCLALGLIWLLDKLDII